MIELSDIRFSYHQRSFKKRRSSRAALFQGLDLQLPSGTLCGLLGPNGAGKSTLLKMICGLVFPEQGRCRVLGAEPARRHPDFLQEIYLLPEDIHVPALTSADFVRLYSPFYPRFDQEAFKAIAQEFGLPLAGKLTALSHGQRKKFLLAFGLATNTRLLVMDEPTNGLDIPSKAQFRRVLLSHFDENRTFIISTHQVHDLEGLIDSVVIMAQGRILLNQTLESLSEKLSVQTETRKPADALYVESGLEGYRVLRERINEDETRLDLSLLFGLVTSQPEQTQRIFSDERKSCDEESAR